MIVPQVMTGIGGICLAVLMLVGVGGVLAMNLEGGPGDSLGWKIAGVVLISAAIGTVIGAVGFSSLLIASMCQII